MRRTAGFVAGLGLAAFSAGCETSFDARQFFPRQLEIASVDAELSDFSTFDATYSYGFGAPPQAYVSRVAVQRANDSSYHLTIEKITSNDSGNDVSTTERNMTADEFHGLREILQSVPITFVFTTPIPWLGGTELGNNVNYRWDSLDAMSVPIGWPTWIVGALKSSEIDAFFAARAP